MEKVWLFSLHLQIANFSSYFTVFQLKCTEKEHIYIKLYLDYQNATSEMHYPE